MKKFSSANPSPSEEAMFIDHQSVRWSSVRSSSYWLHKRFHYAYPGPIRELRQRLVVVPPEQYGDQRLSSFAVHVLGAEHTASSAFDMFGNRVLSFHLPQVEREVTFEVSLALERVGSPDLLPHLSDAQARAFRADTPLTAPDHRIAQVARELAAQHRDPLALAESINTWVYGAMRYGAGATTVQTPAAEALAIGEGLCQDYTHIMLSICRAAGLAARYVSGHLLGEGGSHAWLEVLLPQGSGWVAMPFDPTNHRRANLSYITIAVGRDYGDVAPTSGSYIAPYQGLLTASKRAGLVRVEYAVA
ncbi:transglutaminase family protein [Chloroflexia bacterium SDU3-3]|nr:transglutaminase family protein [Chloroflexia bacterium SDU3-3]